jgi:hypothetical protein
VPSAARPGIAATVDNHPVLLVVLVGAGGYSRLLVSHNPPSSSVVGTVVVHCGYTRGYGGSARRRWMRDLRRRQLGRAQRCR